MRKMQLLTALILAVAFVYLGGIFYSRRRDRQDFVRRLEEPKAAQDRAIVDAHGGKKLTVLSFYATPGTVRPGARAQLCYGVSNARSVRIEPPVPNVWPSFSRCVEVSPAADTEYRLIAEDAEGNTATAATAIRVR